MAIKTQVVNGRSIAQDIKEKLRAEVSEIKSQKDSIPGLVSIVVGDDPESHKFVDLKGKAAERVGVNFTKKAYPKNFDPRLVVEYIQEKNADPAVHGILVQLPLPDGFDRTQILKTIHPYKDVDVLHPKNLGLLIQGESVFISPVVQAVERVIGDPRGKNITIVGAGLLVGKPLAVRLINLGATVTVANEFTQNLAEITRKAEILISATGQKNLIVKKHVREGATVIDAARDVDLNSVTGKAAILSPSPGGIGPLTVAYLLKNTVLSWKKER